MLEKKKHTEAQFYVFQALENLRVYLCEKIIAERHFDHLRAKKILSREDTEEISCRTSSRKRAGKLLDYLQENPKGLDTLVESIRREKTQNFLIQKITDEVLKLRNIKLEHLKGKICWCPRNHLNMTMLLKIKYKTKKNRNDCFVFIQKVSASELHLIYIFFLTLCDFIGRMDYHSMFCFYIHLTIPFIQNFKKILVYTCICF